MSTTKVATSVSMRHSVTTAYRTLGNLIRRLPNQQQAGALKQLREGFRKNADATEDQIPALLEMADKKIAFMRIVTPKDKARDGSQKGSSTYVYKDDGSVDENGRAKVAGKARVSNWTGSNLDPCSVKRHYAGLKRCGFVDNSHAKGIF